ncbi:hypothetical protein ZHAS_00013062 [Anopheles sinensis]|uniref:Uncharacterized protein n=1 Tax=Anopheles sinensis TaxID=74873 RepID=A0A084W4T3_ANOSI|nr:hypothetical protein ZHAS_00013062 [Anopheles sinensis]
MENNEGICAHTQIRTCSDGEEDESEFRSVKSSEQHKSIDIDNTMAFANGFEDMLKTGVKLTGMAGTV